MSNEVSAQAVNRSGLLRAKTGGPYGSDYLSSSSVPDKSGTSICSAGLLSSVSGLSSGPFTISMTRGQPSHPGLARFPNGKSGNASRNSSSASSWPWSSFLQLAGCSRASSTLRKPAPDRLTSCGPSSLASASSLSAWSRMYASSGNPA